MTATQPDLDAAYDLCRRITKAEAKNFYYAFRTLPAAKRPGHIRRLRLLPPLRRHIRRGYAPQGAPCRGSLAFVSRLPKPVKTAATSLSLLRLGDAATRFGIPWEHFDEIVAGVEMDLDVTRYETFDNLREYCHKVASVVGLVSIRIFGHDEHPEVETYAIDLGLAMQLTNILRDIKEDAGRDRVYIPQDELRRFGVSETDLTNGVVRRPVS